ncbi:MAG: adenylate kinase [Gemmatimonadota bacterium]|nr:adenylate kinase [Gemmatimonadota bacterium]MDH5803978.1 adenylate kinase [Gemmatimonadota bacterium]
MNIVLLGAPGSGKGTQGALLSKRAELPKLATGDILRAAVKDETPLGMEAKSFMEKGLLVPDGVILGLIGEVLSSDDAKGGVIMDGFPRTRAQAEAVDEFLAERGDKIDLVIQLDVSDDEIISRVMGRAEKEDRSDDTPEAIRKRLEVYREQTAPLIEFYDERNVVERIDAVGSVEEIAGKVAEVLER